MQKLSVRRYVIFGGAFIVFLCTGTLHMWSIFQRSAMGHYGWDAAKISYTYSILIVSYVVGTFIGGKIQDKIGPRFTIMLGGLLIILGYFFSPVVSPGWSHLMLYLMFAVPVGLGTGGAYTSLLACVQKWFPDKKGFATGFTVCGFGLSLVVFSPLAEWFLGLYSFTSTMRIFGVFIGAVCLLAAQLMKNPPEGYNDRFPDLQKPGILPQRQYKTGAMIRTRAFYIAIAFVVLNAPLYFAVNPTLRTYAEARGLTPQLALTAVMCVGAFSTLGRFAIPTLSDKTGRRPMLFVITASGLAGSALMLVPNSYVFLASVCVMGFSFGAMPPMHSATVSDLFGIENAGSNFGFFNMLSGISILSYPAIVNALTARFPLERAFSTAFIGCIVIYCVQAVFILFLPEPKRVASGEITLQQEPAAMK